MEVIWSNLLLEMRPNFKVLFEINKLFGALYS